MQILIRHSYENIIILYPTKAYIRELKKNRIMHIDPYENKQSTRREININRQQPKGFCTNPFKFQFIKQWWEIQEKEKGFKGSPL